jgi:hypothetical protein
MKIFPNIYVTPIHLPQKQFKDSYGNANAYVTMNPSLYITPTGDITLLVRSVNYRKYRDKQFTLNELPLSVSTYTICRGKMESNKPLIFNFTMDDLTLEYNQPTYSTYWKGMEDIRFITQYQVLVTIPEFNPGGNPSIFLANIYNNRISYCIPCEPSNTEKNWMPFLLNNEPMVIYSIDPFIVKTVLDAELIEVATSLPPLKGYHGSTNGLAYKDGFLFLIHQSRDISYHRWLYYNPVSHHVKVSDEFIFFKNTYIEFPCSLCEWESRIFISIGINDDTAYIIEVSKREIENFFSF